MFVEGVRFRLLFVCCLLFDVVCRLMFVVLLLGVHCLPLAFFSKCYVLGIVLFVR